MLPSKILEKQGKTFGIKLNSSLDSGNFYVPGPGTYNGEKHKRLNLQYSMGQKLNDGLNKNGNPGPGNYETRKTLEGAPSTKFGTGQRSGLGLGSKDSPGPGGHNPDFYKVSK